VALATIGGLVVKISGLDPKKVFDFPNYLWVYLLHLVVPLLSCFTLCVIYYVRHEPLRRAVARQLKNVLRQV
jgi:hypothetical protein